MPRKPATIEQSTESTESGSDLLNEFAEQTASATSSKKAAKEKAPKSERTPRAKAEKPAKPVLTLADVVAKQEQNPFPWMVRNVLELAQRRMRAATAEDGLTIEQALSDVASFYAQLAADAVALSKSAGVEEKSTESISRLIAERFEHQLARLGQVYGQPKKPAPYTRDSDDREAFAVNSEGEPDTGDDNLPPVRSAADEFFGR